jgi:Fe2+ transport system protein FeoA
MTLSAARCGERLRVVCVRGESPECVRLREMGFNEAAEVCKVTDGGALICQLSGVRLAIARKLGADVMVERIQP